MPAAAIAFCVAWTLAPFALAAPLFGAHPTEPVFSQSVGVAALSAMALAQLLATRPRALEGLFSGLDRMYVAHKWLAVAALALILLHDNTIAEIRSLGRPTGFADTAEGLGELALNGLIVLLAASLLTIIPYRYWRYSHKAVGAAFALGSVHALGVLRPFDLTDPLGLWLVAMCVLGVASWLYTLLPVGLVARMREHRIVSLNREGDALAIELEPSGRPGRPRRPGQFAFVSFDDVPGREAHPFTVSSAPRDDGGVRVTVKALGDDTTRFSEALSVGGRARVSPAYGRFTPGDGVRPQIWIAAGVGVTPFASSTEALRAETSTADAPIDVFLCGRRREAIPHLALFETAAAAEPRLRLHIFESAAGERLTADLIVASARRPLAETEVAFCGPEAMGKALRRDLEAAGLPPGRFRTEAFRLRAGLGLLPERWLAALPDPVRRIIAPAAPGAPAKRRRA